jgi:hypothetical protein
VPPEKATSGTLSHLLGKTLEGTLSLVPLGTTVNAEEPRVQQKVSLIIDTGPSILVILFSPGPRSSKKITVQGISGQPLQHYFTQPLACSWGDFHFCHSFLIVPETPTPLLGQDLLPKLGVQLLLPQESTFACP